MPFVPLPFVVALLLLILLAWQARRDDEAPANRPFLALIAACALQSTLLGLRWGYDIKALGYVLPVVAATLPPLVYASFAGLAPKGSARERARTWLHAIPAVLIALLVAFWRQPIDVVLIAVYLGYAAVLLKLAKSGPDALGLARLEGAISAHRALKIASAALVASAMVDAIVVLDLGWMRGQHAAAIVGFANVVGLFALGLAASVAGRTRPPVETEEPPASEPAAHTEADGEVVAKIDDLMRTQGLFRDADLNLNRLGRKAAIPARRISIAVNRIRGKNVSQYVNEFRIAEACRLLTATDQPVTTIMFESGFQTKSNFNREFRRVTGMNPLTWRTTKAPA